MKRILLAAALLVLTAFSPAFAGDKVHRLALQISDNSQEKMTAVLNVAANVSRHYSEVGEEVEIRIVAFNAGLNMLRLDKSPVLDRLKSFTESLPNVTFEACGNTRDTMARTENKRPDEIPLLPDAKIVTAGVVSLIELGEKGWTIVRP
jgi:intracellular sulfur oxidation DsrE/DsrF family protein